MTSKGRYLYQDAFSGHFQIPLELASRMVTIIAREGVLSMTDLFNYLLPYPTIFSHVIQNYHPLLIYLPSLL